MTQNPTCSQNYVIKFRIKFSQELGKSLRGWIWLFYSALLGISSIEFHLGFTLLYALQYPTGRVDDNNNVCPVRDQDTLEQLVKPKVIQRIDNLACKSQVCSARLRVRIFT